MESCKLQLHEVKSKIVNLRGFSQPKYPKGFDFLGFTIRPRAYKTKGTGKVKDPWKKSPRKSTPSFVGLSIIITSFGKMICVLFGINFINMKSRMKGDFHVRFRENAGVKSPLRDSIVSNGGQTLRNYNEKFN